MISREQLEQIAERTVTEHMIYDDMSWYSFNGEPIINMEYNDLFIRVKNAFAMDIGICGCGLPFETWEQVYRYLNVLICIENEQWDELDKRSRSFYKQNYGLAQFMAYILDDKEYTEHGSGIGGAWLTDKGKDLLAILDTYVNEEIESDIFGD